MAWFTDSLRAAIGAVTSPFGRGPQQSVASQLFTPQLAFAAYLSSGMLRKVLDIPAQDRTREWRDWQGIDADEITKIENEEKRLGLLAKVKQAEVLRGLGGGALILALPGALDQPAPANGKLIAVNVVSRWQLTLQDIDENMASPTYGEPRMFRINGGTKTEQNIHPSRVIAFRGEALPMGVGISAEDAYWGSSRLERVFAEVQKADNAALWFSELVKKAKLLRVGIANLTDYNATEDGRAKLNARVALIATGESVLNATVYDAGNGTNPAEKIDDYQVTWAGIPAMMDAFDQRVAAVADIPFTRLMGRSPAGMNATGEHDAANWAATIAAGQELELRPCLERLDPYLYANAGVQSPDVWWKFSPIHKPSAKEDADRFKVTAEAIELIAKVDALPQRPFNAGVQSVLEANGWMPGAVPELAKLSEDERFGLSPDDDGSDPSALTEGGDPDVSPTAAGGEEAPTRRRAANDKAPEDSEA